MENNSEHVLEEFEGNKEIYATFWQRLFALLIDGLVISPTIFIDWYNKINWKSPVILIAASTLALLYKPLMEFKYGATVGKMALKLLVVNKDFQRASLINVLLRNIFDILERIVVLICTLLVFNMPAFDNLSTIKEFGELQNTILNPYVVLYIPTAIMIVEIIFLVTDKRKRALHDRIGETFVIKR